MCVGTHTVGQIHKQPNLEEGKRINTLWVCRGLLSLSESVSQQYLPHGYLCKRKIQTGVIGFFLHLYSFTQSVPWKIVAFASSTPGVNKNALFVPQERKT